MSNRNSVPLVLVMLLSAVGGTASVAAQAAAGARRREPCPTL